MGSSNASRNGHGGSPTSGTHTRRTFDEGEDSIFALSLDDVMDDRPWTANELMSGKTPSAGDPSETASFIAAAQHLAPKPPVADLDDFAARQFAFDSWAAADLDETSAGAPTLDEPVNPLVAASVGPPRTTTIRTTTVMAAKTTAMKIVTVTVTTAPAMGTMIDTATRSATATDDRAD